MLPCVSGSIPADRCSSFSNARRYVGRPRLAHPSFDPSAAVAMASWAAMISWMAVATGTRPVLITR